MYDTIEETILIIPNSGVRISLLVRNDEDTFKEFSRNDGSKSLRMLSSDYLTISYRDGGSYYSATASYLCMETFKAGMKECEEFIGESFYIENGCYYVKKGYENGFKIEDLCNGRSLLFVPFVDNNTEAKTSEPGVYLYFTADVAAFVPYSGFIAMVELCRRFDLYTASKMLINNAMLYELMKDKK